MKLSEPDSTSVQRVLLRRRSSTRQMPASLQRLYRLLLDILPKVCVDFDDEARAGISKTTGFEARVPAVLVRPRCTEEVQMAVRLAARHGTHVYPVSGGRNWGYGDACAYREDCMLLDLSRMNRIVEVNEELAYCVVEPGVTQGQLRQHLLASGCKLVADAVGAGPDCSIIGNLMERGIGLSRYADRAGHSCNYEVVLPDGNLLHTGFGGCPGAPAQHVYKAGVGPQLDGLFAQSNLGIVTRATVWLMPKPERYEAFFLMLRTEQPLGALMEALRKLRLSGTVRCSVHAFNGLRLLGGHERFPWHAADGTQALEVAAPELLQRMLDRHGIPAWVATGSLTGARAEVAAQKREMKRVLRAVPGLQAVFLSDRKLRLLKGVRRGLERCKLLPGLCRRLEKVEIWTDFLQGTPSYKTLTGSHWRARGEAGSDNDPRDSNSGLVWIPPVLPATREAVEEVTAIGKRLFHKHGFEFSVTISMLNDRALCYLMSIHFNRGDEKEMARAKACHDELLVELLARGYIPYRGGPQSMPFLQGAAPDFWTFAKRLKRALDPDGVISPKRYI